ncbi:YwqG family protein [Inquilinus limosus]|uniref:DUF1963 domain-containing protein n=1 Tax=Inquilinus limosus TaxID=171674 RepID=A0A211ZKP6_9PROT|nr:YwqG family protein [Inquilinus limosus]OWJ65820.1 hypothetical protein BWR60_17430 [Inquilinus limosus]
MFTSKEQIEASLRAARVSAARAAALAARAKPCVRLEAIVLAEDETIPLGATRIGGRPDLPAGTAWPVRPPYPDAADRIAETRATLENIRATNEAALARNSPYAWSSDKVEAQARYLLDAIAPVAEARPLTFVAQLDLAGIQTVQPLDPDIPVAGRLVFFYDVEQQPEGVNPEDSAGWVVLHDTADASTLSRIVPPSDAVSSFRPLRGHGRAAVSPVPEEEAFPSDRSDPDRASLVEWYSDRYDALLGRIDWRAHQAGGHPDQIQLGPQPGRKAEDWILLMQIDSDHRSGMTWGDSGMLYVWIRREDLQARRFDRARVILQSL